MSYFLIQTFLKDVLYFCSIHKPSKGALYFGSISVTNHQNVPFISAFVHVDFLVLWSDTLRVYLNRGAFSTGWYFFKSERNVQYLFKEKTTIREIDLV